VSWLKVEIYENTGGKMTRVKRVKQMAKRYTPPSLFVGELLVWKGSNWRLQAVSSNGGQVTLEDETGEGKTAQFKNAVVVLEYIGKTAGTLKREAAAAKKLATIKRDGFRDVPVVEQEKSDIVIAQPRIITDLSSPEAKQIVAAG
jgi:hypothetical protein